MIRMTVVNLSLMDTFRSRIYAHARDTGKWFGSMVKTWTPWEEDIAKLSDAEKIRRLECDVDNPFGKTVAALALKCFNLKYQPGHYMFQSMEGDCYELEATTIRRVCQGAKTLTGTDLETLAYILTTDDYGHDDTYDGKLTPQEIKFAALLVNTIYNLQRTLSAEHLTCRAFIG